MVNQEEASVHDPGGGLDLHHHGSDVLAQAAGFVQLHAEALELLLQRRGRRRRRLRVAFTSRHGSGAQSRRTEAPERGRYGELGGRTDGEGTQWEVWVRV